jgi:hypothetical protein
VQIYVPDTPETIKVITARHQFMMNKLFNGLDSQDNGDFVEQAESEDLEIHESSLQLGVPRPPSRLELLNQGQKMQV